MKEKVYYFIAAIFLLVLVIKVMPGNNKLDTLRESHIISLFYEDGDIPKNVLDIISRDVRIDPISEFYDKEKDGVIRFNVMAILNHKIQKRQFVKDNDKLRTLIDKALNERHPWVRAEALNVAGNFDLQLYRGKIIELLGDKSLIVSFSAYQFIEDRFPLAEISTIIQGVDADKVDIFKKFVESSDGGKTELNKLAYKEMQLFK